MKISTRKLRKMIREQADYDDRSEQDLDDLIYKLGEAFEYAEDLNPELIVSAINSALTDNHVPLSVRSVR